MKLNQLLVCSLTLFVLKAHAVIYYVSPTGNDSNLGTSTSRPWKTLARVHKANSVLKPGDKVYFRGGDYLITSSLPYEYYFSADGTSSNRITYQNYPGEKPVIVFDWRIAPPVKRYLLIISGNYVTVDGLSFRQTESSRLVSFDGNIEKNINITKPAVWGEGDNVIIRNVTVDNFSSVGIQSGHSKYLLVEGCTIRGTGSHPLYISGAYGKFRNNTLDGSRGKHNAHGIQIQGVLDDPNGGTFQASNFFGNEIYGNLIKNGQGSGVIISGPVANNLIYNNVIINGGINSGQPLSFWEYGGQQIRSGNSFYNNTAIGKSAVSLISQFKVSGKNVKVYNNIFHPSVVVPIGLTTSTNVYNNIFYNVKGSLPSGSGNKLQNPMLMTPTGTSAQSAMLRSGSPAIGTAGSGASTTDYASTARDSRPDKGAWEY